MFKKPLLIASLGAAVALAGLSTRAEAADPVLGALIGGGIGAAIGHNANHHGGAAVGGVIGAVVGSSIAASSNYYASGPYYGDRYYAPAPAAPVYYEPAPVYYEPAPVYAAPVYAAPVYAGPTVVYSSGPYYRHHHRHWH